MPPALTASDLAGLRVVAGAGRGVAGACPARVGTGREGRRQCPSNRALRLRGPVTHSGLAAGGTAPAQRLLSDF